MKSKIGIDNRYSRQILLPEIGANGQEKLGDSVILVMGVGALGSAIANNLARAGVGRIKLADRDIVELSNLQRQMLFDEKDVGSPKATSAAAKLREINSDIEIEPLVTDVNSFNVEGIISGVDLILDGADNLETRFLINDACIKNEVPWVYGGAIGAYGMTMNIIPERTPCFRCIFPRIPSPGAVPTCDSVGVLNTIPAVIGSIQSTEAIKILLGKEDLSDSLLVYDIWGHKFNLVRISRNKECKCCGKRDFEFLKREKGTLVTKICGKDTVQVNPMESGAVSLEELERNLSALGSVVLTEYCLKFHISEYELLVFRDGRALIKGVEDEVRAKSLYAKYIGM